ncbi:hypothetical protein SAMN05421770_104147 [Granulicella rosea]|uniref:Uncharacterized protein n=1 Tax=Granulicella rosea TaxID=474952 RepID=A0A239JUZ2_9BACT|nr:BrnT family toxin [Granulicella rosea]SNT09681.1 hypothetical protein SAMN05421770_104147 [Granulicella rosea]
MYDWDEANIRHIAEHEITPEEAEQALENDPVDAGVQDCEGEQRYVEVGMTHSGRMLVVITTLRGELTRVLTAYRATPLFRAFYFRERGANYGHD